MAFKRSAGIILHPSSLPGQDGIGDLGPEAYRWIDWLSDSGCSLWQVLPLGPTGYGDSPYQCFSAFAGNPFLISPTMLLEQGLLKSNDLQDRPQFPLEKVDFGAVIPWKLTLLDRAYKNFRKSRSAKQKYEFESFKASENRWLDDFALFMSIKESLHGIPWSNWPTPLQMRDQIVLDDFRQQHIHDIERHSYRQFLFFQQWRRLRSYCAQKGILVIGDIPIFVAFDSADAWSNPELFHFNKNRLPTVVAGVPPDYFSPTGQLWGNPLYKWKAHKIDGFSWWKDRIRAALGFFDIIRLDHFRGFAGYWEIPASLPTAEIGKWVKGPGAGFFTAIIKDLGTLPIIAEDLGEITPDVIALRDQFGLPGMKVFQFAFSGDSSDPFLPHQYHDNCIAYTGTHDNDTVKGWYESATQMEQDFCRRYLARSGEDISWDMIRSVWGSVAVFAIAPMQDILGLGNEARMNFPGRLGGNWSWRMNTDLFSKSLKERLREANTLYNRLQNNSKILCKHWSETFSKQASLR